MDEYRRFSASVSAEDFSDGEDGCCDRLDGGERAGRHLRAWRGGARPRRGWPSGARIVLLAAEGGRTRPSACGWARRPTRSENGGGGSPNIRMAGLYDEPRPGAPRQIGDDEVAEVVR